MEKESLGIRLNNPGCLRPAPKGHTFYGEIKNKTGYARFSTVYLGVRALLLVLWKYFNTYHFKSIHQIISRYAPGSDNNNVDSYCDFVCKYVNQVTGEAIRPYDDVFDIFERYEFYHDFLFALAAAICQLESGYHLKRSLYNCLILKVVANYEK